MVSTMACAVEIVECLYNITCQKENRPALDYFSAMMRNAELGKMLYSESFSSPRKIQNVKRAQDSELQVTRKTNPKHKILDANRTPKSLLQVNNAGHKSDVVMLATLSKND